jgi:hypothetical protein
MSGTVLIEDNREFKDLKKETFSGHNKKDVLKSLEKCIALGEVPYAIHWAFELLCSGLVDTLWNSFFMIAVEQVNRANPLIFSYLYMRFFKEFFPLRDAYASDIPRIRNSPSARKIVAEAATLLALSKKAKLPAFPKVTPADYTRDRIREVAKAPLTSYANAIIKADDPSHIIIPSNEIAFAIRRENRDSLHALFWIRWLLEFEKQLKKESGSKLACAKRPVPGIDEKHHTDVVWLLWEVLSHEVSQRPPQEKAPLEKVISVLFRMFCYQYEPSCKNSRKEFLACAVVLLTDIVEWNEPLCQDMTYLRSVVARVDELIMEFKPHERVDAPKGAL